MLNIVDIKEFLQDVGPKTLDDSFALGIQKPRSELGLLVQHLGAIVNFNEMRRCPSIVTRSELELFCKSAPRFAIRIYFKDNGFVNCRRIASFIASIHQNNHAEWGKRYEDTQIAAPHVRNLEIVEELPNKPIEEVIGQQTIVADSLLRAPNKLKGYIYTDISSGDLLKAYGEELPKKDGYPYIPYVKFIDLCGGLCGQAACFMATTILMKYAKSIYGLPEITELAYDPQCLELALSGLTNERMQYYFEKVQLTSSEQVVKPDLHRKNLNLRELGWFRLALRSYIKSGMPIILPVDSEKIAEEIYKDNGYSVRSQLHTETTHCVLLIGCGMRNGVATFIFNDPSTLPFLVAELEQLAKIGCGRNDNDQHIDNGVIIPVTPLAIRMCLLERRIQGVQFPAIGLLRLTEKFHQKEFNGIKCHIGHIYDRFELVHSRENIGKARLAGIESVRRELFRNELGYIFAAVNAEDSDGRWFWLELFPDSIWVWEAELENPSHEAFALVPDHSKAQQEFIINYLQAVVFIVDGVIDSECFETNPALLV